MLGTYALVVHVFDPYNYICIKIVVAVSSQYVNTLHGCMICNIFLQVNISYMHAIFALFLHICQNEIASRETLERDWSSKLSSTQ